MRTIVRLAAALGVLLTGAASASAQTQSVISLLPQDGIRWDAAISAGRQGVNRNDIAPEWNGWYDSGQLTVSGGFYVTPNLKIEADVSRAATARLYLPEVPTPGQTWTYARSREHRFSTTGASGALVYQFFTNQWFHPFAGVGLELLHERQDADPLPSTAEFRPAPGVVIPAVPPLPAFAATRSTVRPFLSSGFKVYVSRRAFLRSDLHIALSRRGAETTTWRAGVGFDF